MALRQLMLEKELKEKRSRMEALGKKDFSAREKEIEAAIEEAATDEDKALVEDAISAFEVEKEQHEKEKADLEQRIGEIENEIAEMERKQETSEKREGTGKTMAEKRTQLAPMTNTAALARIGEERARQMLEAPETRDFIEKATDIIKNKRDVSNLDLTIPEVILPLLRENVFDFSKLLRRVNRTTIKGTGRQIIAGTIPEAVWTEMCANLNELDFGFNQVTLDGYKVGGYIPICNAVLEDSYLNLASEIITMLGQSIGYALDKAILYGRGDANKYMPMGIVTRLAQTAKPDGYPANAPAWVDLHTTNRLTIESATKGAEFFQELVQAVSATATPYARGSLFWAMNSKTYNKLMSNATVIDATGAIVSRINGVMPIVGGDIDVLEFIPDGDIIGGYGSLYLLGERAGEKIESSTHVQWLQDNTVFRATARYDGLPVIANAFVAININGGTPTTSLDFAPDLANHSAELSALSIASATLSPTFAAGTTTYEASTTAASGAITATAKDPSATVKIYVNGAGVASNTPTWLEGKNIVLVTVENGLNKQNYTVTVTKTTAEQTMAVKTAKAAAK